MEAAPDLAAALAAMRAVQGRFPTASDDELLVDGAAIEALGRLVDGARIAFAAEVERRSSKRFGEDSLAFRAGARDGVALVADVARIDVDAAKRRVGIGSALAPRTSLAGDELPSRFPGLTEAVRDGAVGIDAARVIVHAVDGVRRRVEPAELRTMLDALTETAATVPPAILREVAAAWATALDPDGAEDDEREQRRKRGLRLRRPRADGTSTLSLVLTAEHRALLLELLQSRRRSIPLVRTTPGGDDSGEDETIDPEWRPAFEAELRSRTQQDYDTVFETIVAGMQAEQEGRAPTSTLHEVVVQVSAADLEARRGAGWTPGLLGGLPMPVIERQACTGGMRLLVTGDDGEALFLSTTRRVFSTAQKKALVIAAGGRCQFPGCTTPAPFLEAHHVRWFHRDKGPTDIGNGLMLCSYHHHLVHAVNSPIELRPWNGDVYLLPRGWRDDPLPEQRVQRGPITDPRIDEMRRRHDPTRNPWVA